MDEADHVGMAPRLEGKSPCHRDGAPKPGIESRPAECNAKIQVPPEVPDRVAYLDGGVGMNPVLTAKLIPGRGAGAECVAFGRSSFST